MSGTRRPRSYTMLLSANASLDRKLENLRIWECLTDTLSTQELRGNGGHTPSFWLGSYRRGKSMFSVVAIHY